jgi:hypothetical protein
MTAMRDLLIVTYVVSLLGAAIAGSLLTQGGDLFFLVGIFALFIVCMLISIMMVDDYG